MIYLDNAATTAIHPEVLAAMQPYLQDTFGNPSSMHAYGRQARRGVDTARTQIADWIGAKPEEVIFTGGGTESIHAALVGAYLAAEKRHCHVISSRVEHHAVLETLEYIQGLGARVTLLDPEPDGTVAAESVLRALSEDTAVVSLMTVNNELGSVTDTCGIARAVKRERPDVLFHSDMVQALSVLTLELDASAIDLASFSAHKIHGPKGVGALFLRQGTAWKAVQRGGAQERGRRAGTENVPGIVGFAAAVGRLADSFASHLKHLEGLRQRFLDALSTSSTVCVNSPADGVPSILNLHIPGVRAETLLMRLDIAGVAASAGSACTAGSLEPSHVLTAVSGNRDMAEQSIRVSFSDDNTLDEIDAAAQTLLRLTDALKRQ